MSVLKYRGALRWLVPAAAALAVVGGGIAVGALTPAVDPSLPPRSAAELLADVGSARLEGLSGTVVQRADLGLSALPGVLDHPSGQRSADLTPGHGSADLTSLLSGTHTLRVWYSGPDRARVALLGTLGETDIIANGPDVWIWSSRDNTATHRTLFAPTRIPGVLPSAAAPRSSHGALIPQQLADAVLAAIDPGTEVTAGGTVRVAGRDAYELVLAPRDPACLIGAVRIAVDATEHLPLRVRIYPRGDADPAIDVSFTEVTFGRPDPRQFDFNPPPGATVVYESADDRPGAPPGAERGRGSIAIVGSGWTGVLVARLPVLTTEPVDRDGAGRERIIDAVLERLPHVSGSWGSGRLLTGALFSTLITDDGRILVGAVGPNRLLQAASDPAAALPR